MNGVVISLVLFLDACVNCNVMIIIAISDHRVKLTFARKPPYTEPILDPCTLTELMYVLVQCCSCHTVMSEGKGVWYCR